MARGEISQYNWCINPAELQETLLQRGPVCVGTNWYEDMYDPEAKYGNQYLKVSGRIVGGHEYLINGINTNPAEGPPFYRMKNSWGRGWGKSGTARIAMDDLHHLIFDEWGDAVLIKEVAHV